MGNILDIGSGTCPMADRIFERLAQTKRWSPPERWFVHQLMGSTYHALDHRHSSLVVGMERLHPVFTRPPFAGQVKLLPHVGDAREELFVPGSIDTVCLSNVLNAPPPYSPTRRGDGSTYEQWGAYFTILSAQDKQRILRQAVRAVRSSGAIVVLVTMTPTFLDGSCQFLESLGWHVSRAYGSLEPVAIESDRCYWFAVYRMKRMRTQRYPLTERHRKYLLRTIAEERSIEVND